MPARPRPRFLVTGVRRSNALRGRTRGDIKHAVLLALRTWPDKTQAEIARQVGCSFQFVCKTKNQFSTSGELTPPSTVTGRDGKT